MVLALLAVAGVTLGLCLACTAGPGKLGLVDGQLHPCPGSPNCVNSEDHDASIEPLAYAGSGEAAFRSLIEFLGQEPRTEVVSVERDYAHVVFRSALFRFPDDVELRLDEAASVIHVRSASRLGYSDLGANRRRVESIRTRWQAKAQ